jgi:hypothetical protein
VSLPVRKLIDLVPRKPPASAVSPYTPGGLRPLLAGWPEGAITEISGARSSGRTALFHASLAAATAAGELCALVDGADSFDPASAEAAGVQLHRLLWVQCHHDVQDTLKSADLILHGGGFRLMVLDLCDLPPAELQRVPLAWWHRLRLAVESTPSVLLAATAAPLLRQAAAMQLELAGAKGQWPGTLLAGADLHARLRKPVHAAGAAIALRAASQGA